SDARVFHLARIRIRANNRQSRGDPMITTSALSQTPPSVLTDDDRREMELVKRYGATDVYINGEQAGWHPWVNGLKIKPYRYETKFGQFVFVLWAPKAAVLGKHRHRGVVTAVTLEGGWGYFADNLVSLRPDHFFC